MGQKNWDPEPAPERFGQVPFSRGVVFICRHCSRPTTTSRDAVLRAFGERGVVREVSARMRCKWCKKRGMHAALTPYWASADFGSQSDLEKLLEAIRKVKPSGEVS